MPSRHVDSLAAPANPKPIKRIVVSAPRSGTQSLWSALKLLGFKPYHMSELVHRGAGDVKMLVDGMKGEWGIGKKYQREDFDKWLAEYDIFMELPFMMLESTVHAYPDAEYLLVQRKPEKWAKSVEDTVFRMADTINSWPMTYFRYFIPQIYQMSQFAGLFKTWLTGGHTGPEARRNMIYRYTSYLSEVKRLVPAKQLHVIQLEDGYGWDPICEWLGMPVPDTPWPSRANTTEEFNASADGMQTAAAVIGSLGTLAIVAPVAGVAWALYSGRIELPFSIQWK